MNSYKKNINSHTRRYCHVVLNNICRFFTFILSQVKIKKVIDSPLRVIPQGTVDNNLGQDRLAGPKALDPNYCRQPTL